MARQWAWNPPASLLFIFQFDLPPLLRNLCPFSFPRKYRKIFQNEEDLLVIPQKSTNQFPFATNRYRSEVIDQRLISVVVEVQIHDCNRVMLRSCEPRTMKVSREKCVVQRGVKLTGSRYPIVTSLSFPREGEMRRGSLVLSFQGLQEP